MPRIELPAHGWRPRPDQMPVWAALERGVTRIALSAHRRWGKDEVALHWAASAAMQRVGPYWHMLPQASQARKAVWDATNPRTGRRRIDDAFPAEIRSTTREQDMFIRFRNQSTWQVVGSDNYNSLVGSPPVGVVFSEYALADPASWSFIRPILAENGGWAIFISTVRGRNHFSRLVDYARSADDWHAQVITVEDSGVITPEQIDKERRELRAERGSNEADAIIAQEYYCDPSAAIPGAYYGALVTRMESEGRIGDFPALPGLPVGTAWDIGVGDQTVVWFYQQLGNGRVRIVDVLAGTNVGLEWYVGRLMARADWIMPDHIWPPDGNVREWSSGKGRPQLAADYGLRPRVLTVDERGSVEMGIQQVRLLLQNCEINATPMPWPGETIDEARERMVRAVDAIRMYRREWKEKRQTYGDAPLHDWCFTGDTEVLTRYGTCQIMNLPPTGEVLTSCGWSRYANPRVTRKAAQLVEVRFTDGLSVRCTPDHLFKTASGWRSAESLQMGSQIQSSLTPSRSIGVAVYTGAGRAVSISRAAVSSFIEPFGPGRLAKFLRGVTSIIETATRKTMRSKTWSAFPLVSTNRLLGTRIATCTGLAGLANWLATAPQSGTLLTQAGYGTSATQRDQRVGSSGSAKRRNVYSAVANTIASFAQMVMGRSIAQSDARWLTIAHVRPQLEKADVWCMTVPDAEEFSLANGAVVHNCSDYADSLRYLAVGRRPFKGAFASLREPPSTQRRPATALSDYRVLG